MARHPSVEQVARWFNTDHHLEDLRRVSDPVAELADKVMAELPDGPELTAGLRKLLEAKDCFVRAAVDKREEG